jgi:hypothetical protein
VPGPIFMFCAPGVVSRGTEGFGHHLYVLRSRTHFRRYRGHSPDVMFCASRLIFGGTEDVGCRFHVLRTRTHFRRYRGRQLPVSCFALSHSFSAVPRASAPVFMFHALGLIFGGTEVVGSHFNVLRAWTRFRWYRGRRVPFSCFALPDSFSAVPRASDPVFMISAP